MHEQTSHITIRETVFGDERGLSDFQVEVALIRVRWAYEALHLSQAGFIRLFLDLGLTDMLGEAKSESTIKAYLQGNLPQASPDVFHRLITAISCFFHLDLHVFFDQDIDRHEFTKAVRDVFKAHVSRHLMLTEEISELRKQLALKESNPAANTSAGPGPGLITIPVIQRRFSPSRLSLLVFGVIISMLATGFLWFRNSSSEATSYHANSPPELISATIDSRDTWLNTAQTPMEISYGSQLCIKLSNSDIYASAFIEDRGFYYNQEGRLLAGPNQKSPSCTGLWPGIPTTFNASPYKLYLVVSSEKLTVTKDSEPRHNLPGNSYYGPVFIKRLP